MECNKEQKEAIMHRDGPAMVLAGPGAGKTYVITNRVKALIDEYGVKPEQILVVTFSKAAAVEMKERFEMMTGGRRLPVRFGTFHSVFFQILRLAYHYEVKDIATPALKYRFLEETLNETGYEVDDKKEFLSDIEKEISRVKGEGIEIDCYFSSACSAEIFQKMYRGYQEKLQRHRCLDFDDMVVYTYQLLKEREDIRRRWQAQFRYLLIDEFQDINRLQYETVCMLAEPENNLFIVGDDDQSIYGFRGAKPGIMLSFPKRFPDTKQIVLGVNYRCSDEIMKAAERLIGKNNERYEKHIVANKGKEQPVHMKKCENLPDEAEKIVAQIQMYQKEGIAYQEMAVLFRTNMQMRLLAGKLMEHGVPFTMRENLPNLFDTWMAKDIMCYLQLALGNRSREKFLKIANRPVRYLSRTAFTESEVSFDKLRAYYAVKNQEWMEERIWNFEYDLKNLASLSPYAAIHFIRKGIGYDEFLKTYADERNVNADDWFDVLDEMQEMARDKKSIPEFLSFVENYGDTLEEIRQEQKKQQVKEEPGVSLMTMHASKGLEFPVVFVPTLNEDIVPYRKAVQEGNLEEERRMLYVAMTRAKTYLHLSFVKERFHKEAEPSPFLYEISPALKNKINKKRGR
ncbi:ATP-dependent helicase [Clostridium sp. AF36-4]|jgi:DNA helicase-2/ATP-dependent DNA helicase PcrA|uniref:ATP-dependent helicase n=1 Tax=Clostridium sp. AF36-4 TaxID=2293015 RepID=UPI000E3EE761|nr:ATP-dependent helicase [Clostridium sp. AF36-4]RGF55632.1 ATP-dependent helicase [Clostridium sp. AF36-4]HBD40814.1 ATP-dependent DNA helicase [Lachnospiraceae bacterium]